jgi:integration host factor subunit alpha
MKTIRDNTSKKNIASNIFKQIGLPVSYATKILDDVISILISNIVIKKTIKIKNFGTFSLKKKSKRIGRNPKSKIEHEITERNVVAFYSAEDLKKKMNNNDTK